VSPAIELRGLRRVFDQRVGVFGAPRHVVAVDDISLTVPAGRALGIVGESGCGKSTLARIMLGLLRPSSGEVLIDGRVLTGMPRRERARLIQPVFQDPTSSLNPKRRIEDIVAMPLIAAGGDASRHRRDRVAEMLVRVGLTPAMARRFPAELSGGQRQRVAIARALVLEPSILICDEPTSALDVSVQAQILNLLVDLRASLGLTLVFISHNLAVVEHVADEVAVMYLGRIVEQAATETVFRARRHPYTRVLLASALTPEPGLGLPDLRLGDATPDPAHIPTGCRFHPRCPVAIPRCTTEPPARRSVECHLVPAA
jgi:peptide/nickel transport system ATP-binding protein